MDTDTMDILSYLCDDMKPEESRAFRDRMLLDSSLKKSVDKTNEILNLIHLWEPPPMREDMAERVMKKIQGRKISGIEKIHAKGKENRNEYNKYNEQNEHNEQGKVKIPMKEWIDHFFNWIIPYRDSPFFKRLTPGIALISLLFLCIFLLPQQKQEHLNDQSNHTVKGGVKMIRGQRLPVPTLLLETLKPDIERIAEYLDSAGIEVVHSEIYDSGVVVKVRIPEGFDIKEKLGGLGRLVRHNPARIDAEGLSVIVIRSGS